MDTTEMAALLGRPLTSVETTNFNTYLKLARQNLDVLLCMDLCSKEDPRTYSTREGYSTVFVDVFTDIDEVKLNGDVTTDYSVRQWDKRSASWYNSLVFGCKFDKDDEVEITASWGFDKYPIDLQSVLAGLFGLITKKNKFDGTIASKQVEDFRISFNVDADLDASFYQSYNATISKYSLCDIPEIRNGKTGGC